MALKTHLHKENILDIAVKLFSEKGYSATSIRDIARALHISNATLYYYFRDKEHLLFSVIESIAAKVLSTLIEARHESDNPLEGLRRMMFRHAQLMEEDGNRAKIFVEEEHNVISAKYRKIVQYHHRRIYDIYVEQLRELQEAGTIIDVSPTIIAFAILGTTNWCYRWYRKDRPLTIDHIAEILSEILIRGIRKP